MIMNTIIKNILTVAIFAALSASCTDYLDKAPESNITEKEVFGNFNSFQGWVEEMYVCMANYHQNLSGNYFHTFNMTDMMTSVPLWWDDGNYWTQRFLYNPYANLTPDGGVMSKFVWPLAWYAIRKANLGLENIDLLQGTQEEKDLIKGQCLYFRAFYHLELMQFWGGLPYIDKPLSVSEAIALPRLTYAETAARAAEDFEAAARLLLENWAKTNTLVASTDAVRVTKIHALAYKGKDLLYAASPMMNESSTGVNAYDAELCRQAAEAFAEVIEICEQPGSKYHLVENFEDWPSILAVISANMVQRPGNTEVIQNQQVYESYFHIYTTSRACNPVQWGFGNDKVEAPTHNYVKYYHMANGLPTDDPESGYDPNLPWANREPRFYNDIVYDGARMLANGVGHEDLEFARLDNRGVLRNGVGGIAGSVTGYLYKKFNPITCNWYDGNVGNFQAYEPRLRLADVYLMYAEAVFYGYGENAEAKAPNGKYTAHEAIERIRSRAQLPPLPAKYYASGNTPLYNFMETLIRERAVELAFEGFRWFDLRRWNLAGELKYRQKTGLQFDVDASGKPYNVREELLGTRVYEKKHNWVPFQPQFTRIHEGFPQNPGW
jgi:hypothetical protein